MNENQKFSKFGKCACPIRLILRRAMLILIRLIRLISLINKMFLFFVKKTVRHGARIFF